MLLYVNTDTLRVAGARLGSVALRADMLATTAMAVIATIAMQAALEYAPEHVPELPTHDAMMTIGGLVSFAVVFRTKLAWQRYWEAITNLQGMYHRWMDVFAQVVAYAEVSISVHANLKDPKSEAKVERLVALVESIHQNLTLLSALAADRLAHGNIESMARREWAEGVLLSSAVDEGWIMGLPHFREKEDSMAMGRRVTNEWDRRVYTVHVCPTMEQIEKLREASSAMDVVQTWLLVDFSAASLDVEVAPPIVSNLFQKFSDGVHHFEQARKLADVPFPLPFAQSLVALLFVFALLIPVYISTFTRSWVAGPLMSGLVFQGMWGFNELAKEFENPYGEDLNDICLLDFHKRFVNACTDVQEAFAAATGFGADCLERSEHSSPMVGDYNLAL